MDVTISRYRNIIKKEAEKVLKCKYFSIAIQRVWNVKAIAIPAIIRTNGTTTKSFRKHPNNIIERHGELKKTITLGTGHLFRKVPDKKCACDVTWRQFRKFASCTTACSYFFL
jgi:hypothetical protein